MLKNKPFWIALGLLVVYLLAGWALGPRFLMPELQRLVARETGYGLDAGSLRFDPLTWSADLSGVKLSPDEHSPWTEVLASADSVHIRFSFWRLRLAIAELQVNHPVVELEAIPGQEIPFLRRWQQWRRDRSVDPDAAPVTVARWSVQGGKLVSAAGGQPQMVLQDLDLQAGKELAGGERAFSLAVGIADGASLQGEGRFQASAASARGRFEIDGYRNTELISGSENVIRAEGQFDLQIQGDSLLFALSDGRLSARQALACWEGQAFCARVSPLDAGFAMQGQASFAGVDWQQFSAQAKAFKLDLGLGAEGVEILRQAAFAGGRIELRRRQAAPVPGSVPGSDLPPIPSFEMRLQTAGDSPMSAAGLFDQAAEFAETQFEVAGAEPMTGSVRLRNLVDPTSGAQFSRLELQLQDPGAELAHAFIDQHLGSAWSAANLGLQLTAIHQEPDMRLLGRVSLEEVSMAQAGMDEPGQLPAPPGSPAALDPAWLLAMWRNPQNSVELDLPRLSVAPDSRASLQGLLESAILELLGESAQQPFVALSRLVGEESSGPDQVVFPAGSAAFGPGSSEVISSLAGALVKRPGLGLVVPPVYDPLIDRKALQAEQIRTHIALAAAAEAEFQSGSAPTDFSDPVVHSVIDEFARRRLPPAVLVAFFEQFGPADVDRGIVPEGNAAEYYAALFEVLVEYAEIPQGALTTLARYRAQAVMDGLEKQGVGRQRLQSAGQAQPVTAGVDGVPVKLELQLFTEPGNESQPGSEPQTDTQP